MSLYSFLSKGLGMYTFSQKIGLKIQHLHEKYFETMAALLMAEGALNATS